MRGIADQIARLRERMRVLREQNRALQERLTTINIANDAALARLAEAKARAARYLP